MFKQKRVWLASRKFRQYEHAANKSYLETTSVSNVANATFSSLKNATNPLLKISFPKIKIWNFLNPKTSIWEVIRGLSLWKNQNILLLFPRRFCLLKFHDTKNNRISWKSTICWSEKDKFNLPLHRFTENQLLPPKRVVLTSENSRRNPSPNPLATPANVSQTRLQRMLQLSSQKNSSGYKGSPLIHLPVITNLKNENSTYL